MSHHSCYMIFKLVGINFDLNVGFYFDFFLDGVLFVVWLLAVVKPEENPTFFRLAASIMAWPSIRNSFNLSTLTGNPEILTLVGITYHPQNIEPYLPLIHF